MRGEESREDTPAVCPTRHALRLTAVALSCAALGLIFWGLCQLDMPMIRFMRSVHQPWLEAGGDLLGRLGSGAVLVAFSAALLVAGRIGMQATWFRAGLQGLLAHGVAALATQLLKHTIGRPRPRVTHEGEFQFEPSLVSGFDSFPSGHASASFAVATVLTRHFPRLGWVSYLVAALIACSRVWRGSHFPTDVVAGAIVGVLSGALLAYSYMDWRTLLPRVLVRMTLVVMAAFALFWAMVQASSDHREAVVVMGAGIVAMLAGLGLRWKWLLDGRSAKADAWPTLLLGTGLALSTGLWLVLAGALMAGLAWTVSGVRDGDRSGERGGLAQSSCSFWMELALGALLVLAFAVLQRVKGILPIL